MSEIITARNPDIIAAEINTIKEQVIKIAIRAAIEIGGKLTEAKTMVNHGEWCQWLQDNVEYKQSKAEYLMNLYQQYGGKQESLFDDWTNSETFEKLGVSKHVALLALPFDDRKDFAEKVDAEHLSTRQLQSAIQTQLEAERNSREAVEAQLRDTEQILLDAQQQLSAAKSSEGAWQEEIERLTGERDQAEINEENLRKEIDKLNAEKHLAETGEKNAMNKVEVLEKQLKDAKKAVKQAKADLKHAKEHPDVPESMMEELRAQAETEAAEKTEADLQKKLAEAAAALDKEAAKRQEVERQLAEAQKRQQMADPNLMAVQALGTQMIALANSINGHRMKAIMQNQDMAKPIGGYLISVINELRSSFGIKITDLEVVK